LAKTKGIPNQMHIKGGGMMAAVYLWGEFSSWERSCQTSPLFSTFIVLATPLTLGSRRLNPQHINIL